MRCGLAWRDGPARRLWRQAPGETSGGRFGPGPGWAGAGHHSACNPSGHSPYDASGVSAYNASGVSAHDAAGSSASLPAVVKAAKNIAPINPNATSRDG